MVSHVRIKRNGHSKRASRARMISEILRGSRHYVLSAGMRRAAGYTTDVIHEPASCVSSDRDVV